MFFIFFLFPTWSLFYSGADLHQRQLALQLWRHLKLTQTYTEFCDLWFLCGQFGSPNAFLSVKIENKGIRKIKPIQPERLFAVVRNFIYPSSTTYHWYQPLHVLSVSSGQLICFTYCEAQVLLADFFTTSKNIKSGKENRWGSGHTVYSFWPLNGYALSYPARLYRFIYQLFQWT